MTPSEIELTRCFLLGFSVGTLFFSLLVAFVLGVK